MTAYRSDEWIQRCIDSPGRPGYLKRDGHTTHYVEWGEPTNPKVLLLLHGFLGHAHWWDFVAPWFAHDHRVIALDFGGMGDSSWRAKYSGQSFIAEVGAMLQSLGDASITVIGHSFGGRVTAFAARDYPRQISHAIVVDSKIGVLDPPVRSLFSPRPRKVYADLDTACARFRFVPEEPAVSAAIMRHLAEHSVRPEQGGYVWKFDEGLMRDIEWEPLSEEQLLAQVDVPVDFIAGELSGVVPPELARKIGGAIKRGRGPIVVPSAHHHIPVNQPLALATALRALLSDRA
jgi:pimeloyl-ACP methyl ester carboxylesterase